MVTPRTRYAPITSNSNLIAFTLVPLSSQIQQGSSSWMTAESPSTDSRFLPLSYRVPVRSGLSLSSSFIMTSSG